MHIGWQMSRFRRHGGNQVATLLTRWLHRIADHRSSGLHTALNQAGGSKRCYGSLATPEHQRTVQAPIPRSSIASTCTPPIGHQRTACTGRRRRRRSPPPPKMAEPTRPRAWRNTYWLLRHGRSTANERDLIVSHLANGEQPEWGLTEEGRAQAAAAGEQLRALLAAANGSTGSVNGGGSEANASSRNGGGSGENGAAPGGGHGAGTLLFLASPFSRALETAHGASKALGTSHGTPQLQVRWAWRGESEGAGLGRKQGGSRRGGVHSSMRGRLHSALHAHCVLHAPAAEA